MHRSLKILSKLIFIEILQIGAGDSQIFICKRFKFVDDHRIWYAVWSILSLVRYYLFFLLNKSSCIWSYGQKLLLLSDISIKTDIDTLWDLPIKDDTFPVDFSSSVFTWPSIFNWLLIWSFFILRSIIISNSFIFVLQFLLDLPCHALSSSHS